MPLSFNINMKDGVFGLDILGIRTQQGLKRIKKSGVLMKHNYSRYSSLGYFLRFYSFHGNECSCYSQVFTTYLTGNARNKGFD